MQYFTLCHRYLVKSQNVTSVKVLIMQILPLSECYHIIINTGLLSLMYSCVISSLMLQLFDMDLILTIQYIGC